MISILETILTINLKHNNHFIVIVMLGLVFTFNGCTKKVDIISFIEKINGPNLDDYNLIMQRHNNREIFNQEDETSLYRMSFLIHLTYDKDREYSPPSIKLGSCDKKNSAVLFSKSFFTDERNMYYFYFKISELKNIGFSTDKEENLCLYQSETHKNGVSGAMEEFNIQSNQIIVKLDDIEEIVLEYERLIQ